MTRKLIKLLALPHSYNTRQELDYWIYELVPFMTPDQQKQLQTKLQQTKQKQTRISKRALSYINPTI